ncbi:hypothetical protein [Phyllobacterium chamaecytisi]|uniref:hypothetical protein n=1 Tax=Phyllobacterium chamaecytisi TaxID=2876082 RepID=UPI001CCC4580|nr:hypothetical protein [Phyllobacterium sp. KW56]MBZ9604076.1 hypothetical protein [Phyllobacterium sp. KW56]
MGVPSKMPSEHGFDQRLILGRDAHGNWVVCDETGKAAGLFADRASAVHFALFESEYAPAGVVCIPENSIINLQDSGDTDTPSSRDLRKRSRE